MPARLMVPLDALENSALPLVAAYQGDAVEAIPVADMREVWIPIVGDLRIMRFTSPPDTIAEQYRRVLIAYPDAQEAPADASE